MKNKLLVFTLLSATAASADVLSSTQRFFGLGGQAPSYSEDGEEVVPSVLDQAPYSPADSDLGVQEILMERPESTPVQFDIRTSILVTDNAPTAGFLTGSDSSWISATNASLAYRPHIAYGWFADMGLGYDFIRFDDSAATDYENLNLRLGAYRIFPELDDAVLFVRYEYQRLMTNSFSNGDYNAQRIRAGLQKTLWSAPRHRVSTTLSTAYEWTARPASLERNEVALDLSYRYSITDAIYTVASARGYRFEYDQAGREDWTYSMGVELIWQIDRNFSTSASVFFDKNDSNTGFGTNDFQAWTAGVGVGMQLSF
jgi:hypothetical protein